MTALAAIPESPWSLQDQRDLATALRLLERTSLPMRLANSVGGLASRGLTALLSNVPGPVSKMIRKLSVSTASRALTFAYQQVVPTLSDENAPLPGTGKGGFGDRMATITSGALGGAGGLLLTAVELPVTTGLILRAIARIARDEGEDLRDSATREECLKVLGLGTPDGESYFGARLALAEAINAAAGKAAAEALPRIAAACMPRFSANVTWKFAGQALPVVGAASGAAINLAFTQHFQDKARGHFIVRRLERTYGAAQVRQAYDALRAAESLAA
jgi:hypothetical protein